MNLLPKCTICLVGILLLAPQNGLVMAFLRLSGIPAKASRLPRNPKVASFSENKFSVTATTTTTTPLRCSERIPRSVTNEKLQSIVERYVGSMTPSSEWKRTLNYLYRNCNNLSSKQIESVLGFLSSRLDPEVLRGVLQSTPRLLRKNVDTQLEPTWNFLCSLYPPDVLNQALKRKPELLVVRGIGYQADDLNLMQVYLSQELHMSAQQLKKLQTNHPFVFQLKIHKVLPIIDYLRECLSRGSADQDSQRHENTKKVQKILCKLIVLHPQLLQLSLDQNLKPCVDYLQSRCGLSDSDVAILLDSSAAGILALNVERNLGPTIDFLEQILLGKTVNGHNDTINKEEALHDLRSCIVAHPPILGLSLEDNLQVKVRFFDGIDRSDRWSGSDRLAARILKRAPAVYSLSLVQNILPTVSLLAKIWGVCGPSDLERDARLLNNGERQTQTENDLSRLLSEYPSILTLSLQRNILPTVSFFNKTGFIDLDSEWTNQSPASKTTIRGRYIATSLYNRLLPRWHFLQDEVNETLSNDGTVLKIPLHVLAGTTDTAFCKHFNVRTTDYSEYKKVAIPKLKFSYEIDSWLNPLSAVS